MNNLVQENSSELNKIAKLTLQYLCVAACSIPAGLFCYFLISVGVGQNTALILSIMVGFVLAVNIFYYFKIGGTLEDLFLLPFFAPIALINTAIIKNELQESFEEKRIKILNKLITENQLTEFRKTKQKNVDLSQLKQDLLQKSELQLDKELQTRLEKHILTLNKDVTEYILGDLIIIFKKAPLDEFEERLLVEEYKKTLKSSNIHSENPEK